MVMMKHYCIERAFLRKPPLQIYGLFPKGTVYTHPDGNLVLPGITKMKVLSL